MKKKCYVLIEEWLRRIHLECVLQARIKEQYTKNRTNIGEKIHYSFEGSTLTLKDKNEKNDCTAHKPKNRIFCIQYKLVRNLKVLSLKSLKIIKIMTFELRSFK